MRVLAHIHTLNDEAVVEQALAGLRRQTRPPDGVVLVDNGSTDGTLNRTFPDGVTVVRNSANLGTSGAIVQGFIHALKQHYDWTWVFDADSVPEPDALQNLLAFFERLPRSELEKICFLACRLMNAEGEVRHQPTVFTDRSIKFAPMEGGKGRHTRCDYFLWTGSLFRMQAVAEIGLPSVNYVLDDAEMEYGYRARRLGFTSYIVHDSITHQDVGRRPGVDVTRVWSLGRFQLRFVEISPIRTYYHARNWVYFWLYQCRPLRPRGVVKVLAHSLWFPAIFLLRPVSHRKQLAACVRGLWDGLTAHMERRY